MGLVIRALRNIGVQFTWMCVYNLFIGSTSYEFQPLSCHTYKSSISSLVTGPRVRHIGIPKLQQHMPTFPRINVCVRNRILCLSGTGSNRHDTQDTRPSKALPATPREFNVLLQSHAKARNPAAAFELLDTMDRLGVPKDIYTYNAILNACASGPLEDKVRRQTGRPNPHPAY
jgi:pentatricopeptide repeat protein